MSDFPPVSHLPLRAIGQDLAVDRSFAPRLPPPWPRVLDHRPAAPRLTLQCAAENPPDGEAERAALAAFVRAEAAKALPPMLRELALAHGFPVPPRVRIALQRTRWASRSATGTVSASLLLLFLPAALARHVLLHELCHVAHMDHGPEFHALLRSVDPLAAANAAALKTADRNYVPEWILPWR